MQNPKNLTEVIPNKLYFTICTPNVTDQLHYHYFSVNQLFPYFPLRKEIGPLPLTTAFQFFEVLKQELASTTKKVIMYSQPEPTFSQNSVLLLALYLTLILNQKIRQTEAIFINFKTNFSGSTLFSILSAVKKAINSQLINVNTFQWQYNAFYQSVENGNVTELVPGKLLIFPGPIDIKHTLYDQHPFHAKSYIPLFESKKITAVIRLNQSYYNRHDFQNADIHHYDVNFAENQPPSDSCVKQFFAIVEHEKFIAIHSSDSLSRAPTLACCYLMRFYKFSAKEAIGYLRLLRPGSVSENQQIWLIKNEVRLIEETEFVNTFQLQQYQKLAQKAGEQQNRSYSLSPQRINSRVSDFVNSPVRQLQARGFCKLPNIK